MRYHEIASGMQVPISGEEQDIINRAEHGLISGELDERDTEVARLMVQRGLLDRRKKDGKIVYRVNAVTDIWRDR